MSVYTKGKTKGPSHTPVIFCIPHIIDDDQSTQKNLKDTLALPTITLKTES